jgi:hypothetical protein
MAGMQGWKKSMFAQFAHSAMRMRGRARILLALAVLVLTASSLQARPRDDVLTGMFRCASIGDPRMWLDCFYGSAQPLRVALGLKPALPAQVRLAQQPPAISAPPATDLTPRYQVTSDALRCNNIADDRQWLDCYYGAAQPARAQLGLSPAPRTLSAITTGSAAPVFAGGLQSPGRTSPLIDRSAAGSNSAWIQMTSYSFNRYGIFTVSLANGEQWRQLSGDTSLAHWTRPPSHYWVHVTRGALRSLNLNIKGDPAAYKVERFR